MNKTATAAMLEMVKKELMGKNIEGHKVASIREVVVEEIRTENYYLVEMDGEFLHPYIRFEEGYETETLINEIKDAYTLNRVCNAPNIYDQETYRFRVFNLFKAQNEGFLKGKLYRRVADDLVAVPYLQISEGEENAVIYTPLQKEELKLLGISIIAFFKKAENAMKKRIIDTPLTGWVNTHALIEDTLSEEDDPLHLFMCKDIREPWGAYLLGGTKTLKEIHKEVGDFYIIPSSNRETLYFVEEGIFPIEYVCEMIRDINSAVVANDCFLSNNLYLFNGKVVSIVGAESSAQA